MRCKVNRYRQHLGQLQVAFAGELTKADACLERLRQLLRLVASAIAVMTDRAARV